MRKSFLRNLHVCTELLLFGEIFDKEDEE